MLQSAEKELSLFPIIVSGKYGYINEWGEVIVQPKFEVAKRFSEGLARVKLNGKWGFIDQFGEIVIEPTHDLKESRDNRRNLDFHEGIAAFSVAQPGKLTRKWGCIDTSGDVVIPLVWDHISEFSEGIALAGRRVRLTEGRTTVVTSEGFYINRNGDVLDFPIVGDLFSEGLATFRTGEGSERENTASRDKDLTGYIDRSGKVAIEPERRVCERFYEGFARVRVYDMDGWGFIDKSGNLICEMKYKNVGDFHEGLARVLVEDWDEDIEAWGFIDEVGDIVIPANFANVGNFSNGVAAASICVEISPNESMFNAIKCGYIDRHGDWIIEPRFNIICGDFHNELALVGESDKWGYINQLGDYVWTSEGPFGLETQDSVFTGFSIFRGADDRDENFPMGFEIRFF